MKRIEAAWIEQILSFDSPAELDVFLKDLDRKGIQYSIVYQSPLNLRIRKQYNQNTLLKKG